MKKLLLSAIALGLALSASAASFAPKPTYKGSPIPADAEIAMPEDSRADPGCRIKFCKDFYGWFETPVDCDELYVYVPVPEQVATALAGNQVKSITLSANVVSANTLPGVAFVTESIDAEPITATDFNIRDCRNGVVRQQTVTLTDPYTIKENTPFYIGYCVKGPYYDPKGKNSDNPIGVTYEYNALAGFIKPVKEGQSLGVGTIGYNIFLYANTVGEKTSLDGTCMLVGSIANNFTLPVVAENDPVAVQVGIWNFGSDISNIDYTYVIPGREGMELSKKVDLPGGEITMVDLSAGIAPVGHNEAYIHISKLDEFEVSHSIKQPVIAVPKSFDEVRKYYVEEFTGTWCQFCPRGIVAFDWMTQYYGDIFIGAALHVGDQMAADCFDSVVNDFCSSFPTVVLNRDPQYVIDAGFDYVANYYDQAWSTQKAAVKIDWDEVVFNADSTALTASLSTTFPYNEKDADYSVAIVVTEDSIIGIQSNGFAGENIDLDGWENKGTSVPWFFSHVARQYTVGAADCVPASITASVANPCQVEVPLTNLMNKKNIEQVIALVIDNATGTVLNASVMPGLGASAGIESAETAPRATAAGGIGEITISGSYTRARVFTASGAEVGRTTGLAPGLYIVSVDGRAQKVIVR